MARCINFILVITSPLPCHSNLNRDYPYVGPSGSGLVSTRIMIAIEAVGGDRLVSPPCLLHHRVGHGGFSVETEDYHRNKGR